MTVGAGSNEQDAQITTAAALAESARQLAQSAAAFGEESDDVGIYNEWCILVMYVYICSCWYFELFFDVVVGRQSG